jgi:drug/metabolite transporter (DMT)-like permease
MVAVLLAFAAAIVFAAGTSLQHRAAAGSRPELGPSPPGLLLRLARKPGWLLGIGLSGAAFGLHAAALRQGSLSIVQPVVVSAIVFAVFVQAVLDRRLPARKELAWATFSWAGLALFIAVLPSPAAHPPADSSAARIFFAGGIVITDMIVLCAQKTTNPERRGMLLGSAAGVLFGLVAGLVKVLITQNAIGIPALLGQWTLWAILIGGAGAVLINQYAYQTARLSVIMPVLNTVDVLVAIVFGAVVFGERHPTSPTELIAELAGLIAMGIGVWQLARRQDLSTRSGHNPSRRIPAAASTSERP